MNKPGQSDGEFRVWVDGVMAVRQSGMVFRKTTQLGANGLFFSTFFGGSDSSWATPVDTFAYFANFSISDVCPFANKLCPNRCSDHGVCAENGVCSCASGWTGPQCDCSGCTTNNILVNQTIRSCYHSGWNLAISITNLSKNNTISSISLKATMPTTGTTVSASGMTLVSQSGNVYTFSVTKKITPGGIDSSIGMDIHPEVFATFTIGEITY